MATPVAPPAPPPAGLGSASLPLAVAVVGLIVYASLYPFTDWNWPAGETLGSMLVPPWPRYHLRFDIWANFLGYLPLGALVFLAALRRGASPLRAGIGTAVFASLLSWSMEFTQHFLPHRYASLEDWTLNSLGGAAGVLAGLVLDAGGVIDRWHSLRERWFTPHSGTTQVLLVLWPVGFLFPSPVPFGLGPSWERVEEAAHDLLADHPWGPSLDWLWAGLASDSNALSPAAEGFAEALGMLGPCLLAFSVMRPGWRRAVVVAVGLVAGFGANTLSSALNFGPLHALAWITPVVPVSLLVGTLFCAMSMPLGRRACAAMGLVALSVGSVLVAQAPSDPYYAESLAAWEQGRFIHFHGLAQWIGWLLPVAAGAVLFGRLLAPQRAPAGGSRSFPPA
jgi:VanZ family protein